MKKYRYFLRLVVGASILYTNLVQEAYCTPAQIRGLSIKLPDSPQQHNDAGAPELASISTKIPVAKPCATLAEVSCIFENDLSDVDTDDEGAYEDIQRLGEIPVTKNTKPYNRSRHPGRAKKTEDYDSTSNYVKVEFAPEALRNQLSQDAFAIVKALNNAESEKHTTCMCVALRDKHEHVKKFAFHNGANVMSPAMRTKAHELGYDVIQVEQSHAEGQFLQFLLHRHRKRPGLYTHIMGMGGSRRHCSECDHIFKLLLGSKYYEFTASVYEKHEEVVLPTTGQAEWDDLLSRFKKMSTNTNVSVAPASFTPIPDASVAITTPGTVSDQDSIENKTYPNCYVPEILQDCYRRETGINYDFSDNRLTKSTKQTTRKRSGSAPKPVG